MSPVLPSESNNLSQELASSASRIAPEPVSYTHLQREDQSIFQTIESDDEFERVVAHVEELARQSEQENAGEE